MNMYSQEIAEWKIKYEKKFLSDKGHIERGNSAKKVMCHLAYFVANILMKCYTRMLWSYFETITFIFVARMEILFNYSSYVLSWCVYAELHHALWINFYLFYWYFLDALKNSCRCEQLLRIQYTWKKSFQFIYNHLK